MRKIIHIEGLDRTGKDTLKSEIIKFTEGKTMVIVRSYLSQLVYSRIFNRKIDENFFWSQLKSAFENNDLFVYLYCDESVLIDRIIKTKETDISAKDISTHMKVFNDILIEAAQLDIDIFQFDCSNLTPSEIVNKINSIV